MPLLCHGPHGFQNRTADRDRGLETCLETVPRQRLETPNTAIFTKVVYLFRIGPYKLVDLCKWSAFVNNRTMRDNCSAAPRLQHCVEITSVSFTVSAVLSRSRLGLEGNCLGLVLVSADSENKCLCLVSVSNTNCLVSVSSRLKLSRTQHWWVYQLANQIINQIITKLCNYNRNKEIIYELNETGLRARCFCLHSRGMIGLPKQSNLQPAFIFLTLLSNVFLHQHLGELDVIEAEVIEALKDRVRLHNRFQNNYQWLSVLNCLFCIVSNSNRYEIHWDKVWKIASKLWWWKEWKRQPKLVTKS